jgi:radical S-adenosyl methionine domain-containing protein 2
MHFTFIIIRYIILWLLKLSGFRFHRHRTPVSVNYHFTRKCNYECGFCFHTAKTSYILDLDKAKKGLRLLKEAGMRKINFAGGEPFLYPKFLGQLLEFCKKDLALESVSIVTNGSRVKDRFLSTFGQYIDVLAVSCDSFQEEVNVKIGRGSGSHLPNVLRLSRLCREHDIKFKLNTVVNKYNYQEDMNQQISKIQPFRWKCFQVLVIDGENDSTATLRNANPFTITDEEYESFCNRHSHTQQRHEELVSDPR